MQDTHVSLAHGNGGRYMRELIQEIFARHLGNPLLDTDSDAAVLPWDAAQGDLAFTTDSFTVQPIEFPGGNIGSLAVHGTCNDLAVAGAVPRYLSLGVLLEGLGRKADAAEAYRAALRGDPRMADCHYNLALLCEQLRLPQEAIRHMAQYRRLVAQK